VELLLRSLHRCLVTDDNQVLLKDVQRLMLLRKIFADAQSSITTRMLVLSLWDCVALDCSFCDYFVESGLCGSLIDHSFRILTAGPSPSADDIAFASKCVFVLTKCCRQSNVVSHLHRSGYLMFLIFALLSSEPTGSLCQDACTLHSPFLELSNMVIAAIHCLAVDKSRGSLVTIHLRKFFPAAFVEYFLLDQNESDSPECRENMQDGSLIPPALLAHSSLAEALWQTWAAPTLMWAPEDAASLKQYCLDAHLEIQQLNREARMKKEQLPCWDPKGYRTSAVIYEENHLVAGVYLCALQSHPDIPLPCPTELMKKALAQLAVVAQNKCIPLQGPLEPPKWNIDLCDTIALVIRILGTPGVVMREESSSASRAVFALEKALVLQHETDSAVAVPLIIQCIRSLRLCATIAAATHSQSTPAALARSELEPSPEVSSEPL
jgi:hypothetical protein